MRKSLTIIILLSLLANFSFAQSKAVLRKFKPLCDTLNTLIQERTSIKPNMQLSAVMKRGNEVDFYFNQSLVSVSWRPHDKEWLRNAIKENLPYDYRKYKVGRIYGANIDFDRLRIPEINSDGEPNTSEYKIEDKGRHSIPFIERIGAQKFKKGLNNRYIALWQSHGRYFEQKTDRWEWQRAQYFSTVEDMFTQSFVLPYLIPMLENAGAYVMTPRERDTQRAEYICDNDESFSEPREEGIRKAGKYSESGKWEDAGPGFADKKKYYVHNDNPFIMGSARQAKCTEKQKNKAEIKWRPEISGKEDFAVYISYKSLPKSTTAAHYEVHHAGGTTEFIVNQTMGGGTWIYLGTFTLDKDSYVSLDNVSPEGRKSQNGKIVTADAVRFGGGMGKIARGTKQSPDSLWTTSGVPSYMEGALYNMQWSGVDSTILTRYENDYTNDFANRGEWVNMMAGGSYVFPKREGKGIPFDLSLAFHSDAGITPNDSIVGTLGIYTLKSDGSDKYPSGEDRMAGREFTDYVQSQVVKDIRKVYEPLWTRRQIWDRSYSECRTTPVPGMILELLSHQNFADMKYGLDPNFKFTVSRAVYKGILKFLSTRYDHPYVVQPLPVNSFSAIIQKNGKVRLSWKETPDSLEKTAKANGFILYTRVNGKAFDNGLIIKNMKEHKGVFSCEVPIEKGKIYSFKVQAFNEGGKSFPSETLSCGISGSTNKNILIVNNFDRVSAPAWFDTPQYAGFDEKLDGGVPYIKDISYIGNMYQFRREMPWSDDDNPGFGASYSDLAGLQIAGNTFDYPYIHGKALLDLGYNFSSSSSLAFQNDTTSAWTIDLICGKQVTTGFGRNVVPERFTVFPEKLQARIRELSDRGKNIIVSGSNIGTDVYDAVYPVRYDSTYRQKTKKFVNEVLGYKWVTNYASRLGGVWKMNSSKMDTSPIKRRFEFYNQPNEKMYCVETPDGILPFSSKSSVFLRYTDTNISAGVSYDSGRNKVVSIGFPIETIKEESDMRNVLQTCLRFFEKK